MPHDWAAILFQDWVQCSGISHWNNRVVLILLLRVSVSEWEYAKKAQLQIIFIPRVKGERGRGRRDWGSEESVEYCPTSQVLFSSVLKFYRAPESCESRGSKSRIFSFYIFASPSFARLLSQRDSRFSLRLFHF